MAPHLAEPTDLLRPLIRSARTVARTILLTLAIGLAILHLKLRGRHWDGPRRALWLSQLSRKVLRLLGVQVVCSGSPPSKGLLVANHLSYLDILALSALHPTVFVSKAEVRNWPVFGFLAAASGSVFVDRKKRTDVARAGSDIAAPLQAGLPVCVFPEGTSSDGSTVLPFYPSLLELAAESAIEVTAAGIDYAPSWGTSGQQVCYWGDMELAPHLLGLMGQDWVVAKVRFGPPLKRPAHRKALALSLREEVLSLRAQ
jgi:1-acyl-sn-glycerol-3-phosphate acyltransferase